MTVPVIALKTACVAVLDSPAHHSFGGTSGTSATTRKELAIASHKLVEKEVEKDDDIAWTPLHASVHNLPTKIHVALTQLLPLFYEKAAQGLLLSTGWMCNTKLQNSSTRDRYQLTSMHHCMLQPNAPSSMHGEEKFGTNSVVTILKWQCGKQCNWLVLVKGHFISGWTNVLALEGITSSRTAKLLSQSFSPNQFKVGS